MQSGTQAIGEFPYRREEWVGNTTWVHQGSSKMVPYVQLSNYNLVHSVIRQDIPSQTVVYCTPLHKTPTTLVMHQWSFTHHAALVVQGHHYAQGIHPLSNLSWPLQNYHALDALGGPRDCLRTVHL